MPCKVVAAEKGGGYNIVDPNGKVVGSSKDLSDARKSCRIRNEKSGGQDNSKKSLPAPESTE